MKSPVGEFIRSERERQGYGNRDLVRMIEQKKLCGRRISSAYLSQVETGEAPNDTIGIDILWAIGVVLRIDPLKMFVMSRGMDEKYLDPKERDKLWSVR